MKSYLMQVPVASNIALRKDAFTGSLASFWTSIQTTGSKLNQGENEIFYDVSADWHSNALWTPTDTLATFGAAVFTVRLRGDTKDFGVFVADSQSPTNPTAFASGRGIVYSSSSGFPQFYEDTGAAVPIGDGFQSVGSQWVRAIDYTFILIPRTTIGLFIYVSGGHFGTWPTATLVAVVSDMTYTTPTAGAVHKESGSSTAILTSSMANPTVIASNGHGITTGDKVIIAGHTSTPDINGEWVATNTGTNTFTIPANVTVAGIGGTVTRGTSHARLYDYLQVLPQRMPTAFQTQYGVANMYDSFAGTNGDLTTGRVPTVQNNGTTTWNVGGTIQSNKLSLPASTSIAIPCGPVGVANGVAEITVTVPVGGTPSFYLKCPSAASYLAGHIDLTKISIKYYDGATETELASTSSYKLVASHVMRLRILYTGTVFATYLTDITAGTAEVFCCAAVTVSIANRNYGLQNDGSNTLTLDDAAAYPATYVFPYKWRGPIPSVVTAASTSYGPDAFTGADATVIDTGVWTVLSTLSGFTLSTDWKINSNRMRLSTANEAGAVVKSVGSPNHGASTDTRHTGTEPSDTTTDIGCCVVLRYNSSTNFIYVRLLKQGTSGEIEAFEVKAGVAQPILVYVSTGTTATWAANTVYNLAAYVNGTNLSVYLNGELWCQGTVSLLTGNSCGFGSLHSNVIGFAEHDNVTLYLT